MDEQFCLFTATPDEMIRAGEHALAKLYTLQTGEQMPEPIRHNVVRIKRISGKPSIYDIKTVGGVQ